MNINITKGVRKVFKIDMMIKIKKGESIDIPKNCVHYIKNKIINISTFIEI